MKPGTHSTPVSAITLKHLRQSLFTYNFLLTNLNEISSFSVLFSTSCISKGCFNNVLFVSVLSSIIVLLFYQIFPKLIGSVILNFSLRAIIPRLMLTASSTPFINVTLYDLWLVRLTCWCT